LARTPIRPDIIDRHVDLRRRVRRLETTAVGTKPTYAPPTSHPHPIAEHLSHPTTVPHAKPLGAVAARLWGAEQREEDANIHRLLRLAREKVQAMDWIGNMGAILFNKDGVNPYSRGVGTGETVEIGRTPLAPPRLARRQVGNWMHPILEPGRPKHMGTEWLGSTGFFTGKAMYGGYNVTDPDAEEVYQGRYRARGLYYPNAVDSGGSELALHPVPSGKITGLNEDGFVFAYGTPWNGPYQYGYGRGPGGHRDYDAGNMPIEDYPLIIDAHFQSGLPDVDLIRTHVGPGSDALESKLGLMEFALPDPAPYISDQYPTRNYVENLTDMDPAYPGNHTIQKRYVWIPDSWLRSWGPPFPWVTGMPTPAGGNLNYVQHSQLGGGPLNHWKRPFTQRAYAQVEANYEADLSGSEFDDLWAWWESVINDPGSDYSAGEWVHCGAEVYAIKRHGMVHLRGLGWTNSTPGYGQAFAILPVGYRPSVNLFAKGVGPVDLHSNCYIQASDGQIMNALGAWSGSWMWLDGIMFPHA
jgi:hypothetical protein